MKKFLVMTCVLGIMAIGSAMADAGGWGLSFTALANTEVLAGGDLGTINDTGQNIAGPLYLGVGNTEFSGTTFGPNAAFAYATTGAVEVDAVTHRTEYVSSSIKAANATAGNDNVWNFTVFGGTGYTGANTNLLVSLIDFGYGSEVDNSPAAGFNYTLTSGSQSWDLNSAIGAADGTIIKFITPGLGTAVAPISFTLTQSVPVPEPSSFLALGSGLVGLVGFVSRRRRA